MVGLFKIQKRSNHCTKNVRIQSYSGPYFPAYGLNMERFGVSLCIQSKCGKMWIRITLDTDTFHAVNGFWRFLFLIYFSKYYQKISTWDRTKSVFLLLFTMHPKMLQTIIILGHCNDLIVVLVHHYGKKKKAAKSTSSQFYISIPPKNIGKIHGFLMS